MEVRSASIAANFCGFRAFAEQLPHYNAFVLHSATFDVSGVGVAFAAHSGTGKTTHMMLWQKLLGERMTIVNGDKPIVRFFDESAENDLVIARRGRERVRWTKQRAKRSAAVEQHAALQACVCSGTARV